MKLWYSNTTLHDVTTQKTSTWNFPCDCLYSSVCFCVIHWFIGI